MTVELNPVRWGCWALQHLRAGLCSRRRDVEYAVTHAVASESGQGRSVRVDAWIDAGP
jgi:hypothetical protein